MPAPPTGALSLQGLVAGMADPEWAEESITDGESPLTVVDLSGGQVGEIPVAAAQPLAGGAVPWRIIVGVADRPRPEVPLGVFDALLCPPAPEAEGRGAKDVAAEGWADVADLDGGVAAVRRTCEVAPMAACVMAQLLRLNEHLSVAEATLTESLAYSLLLAGPEFADWLAGRGPMTYRPASRPVEIGSDDDVVTITLNRPDVRNAYDSATRDALVDVLRALAALPSCPPIRLRGNGPTFSSGGDLSQFGTSADPVTAHGVRTSRLPGLLLRALGATAWVHGTCVGAGIELPAFCPLVVAAPGTTFRLPEVSMGLVPGAGGTASIPARIGRHRVAYMALSGSAVTAETALDWGLVDSIRPLPGTG